jgi:hypothetical protein
VSVAALVGDLAAYSADSTDASWVVPWECVEDIYCRKKYWSFSEVVLALATRLSDSY